MVNDVSPKVLNSVLALAVPGALLTAVGSALPNPRLRQVGATMLGASVGIAAVGWASRDPQREPYIEPGFHELEPEPAEHRSTELAGGEAVPHPPN